MTVKVLGTLLIFACTASLASDAGIEAFNRALIDATTRMDNAAALALWEEDGISLSAVQTHHWQEGDRKISR